MAVGNFINGACCEPFHSEPVVHDAKSGASLKVGSRRLLVFVENTAYEPAQLAHRCESGSVGQSRLVRSSTASVQKRDAWLALNDKQGAELLAHVTLKRQQKVRAPALPGHMHKGAQSMPTGLQAPGYDVVGKPVRVANAYSMVAIDQLNFSEAHIERLEREIKSAQAQAGGVPSTIKPFYDGHEVAAGGEPVYDQTPDPFYETVQEPLDDRSYGLTAESEKVRKAAAWAPESEVVYSDPEELDGGSHELLALLEMGRNKRHAFISG